MGRIHSTVRGARRRFGGAAVALLLLAGPALGGCSASGGSASAASASGGSPAAGTRTGASGTAGPTQGTGQDGGRAAQVEQDCYEQVHGLKRLRAVTRGATVVLSWADDLAPAGVAVYRVFRRPAGAEVGDWTPMSRLELTRADPRQYVDPVPVGPADYGLTVVGACGQVPLCEDGPCVRIRYEPPAASRAS